MSFFQTGFVEIPLKKLPTKISTFQHITEFRSLNETCDRTFCLARLNPGGIEEVQIFVLRKAFSDQN